jgi:hypothetical protein
MFKLKKSFFYSVTLLVLSFIIYIPSLSHQFVWDDSDAIKKKNYKYQTFLNLLVPKQSLKKGNYYRPTVYLSYLVDQKLWGQKPFGYHLSNLIFNSFTVVLLFWFVYFFFSSLKTEGNSYHIAFFSSLVFLLHPMHVESVSWIAGRTDILCTLFLLMGLLFHIVSYRRLAFVPIAIMAFYLSLLSKELAIVFVPLVIVIDFATEQIKNKNSLIKYILYITVLVLYFYLRTKSFVNITPVSEKNVNIAVSSDFLRYFDMLLVLISSYYSYLYKLLVPVDFNAFIAEVTKDLYYLIPSFLVLGSVLIGLIYSLIKRLKLIYFIILWIFISLAPSTILAIIKMTPTSLAERYLYLPSVAFAMAVGYLFYKFIYKKTRIMYSCSVLILIVIFYTPLNINRQRVWSDDLSLWGETSVASSKSCLPHNNYGSALKRAGRYDEALRQYMFVIDEEIKCRDIEKALVYNNLGTALLEKEQYTEGRKYLKKAMELNKYYHSPHMNLGVNYLLSALSTKSEIEFRLAKQSFKNSIKLKPNSGISHHYLSIAYKETGDFKNAEIHANKALRLGIPPAQKKDSLRILDEIQNSDFKED